MREAYLDQELAVALAARGGVPAPLTADRLAQWQQADAARRPRPSLAELAAGGRFEVGEAEGLVWAAPPGRSGGCRCSTTCTGAD
ncbi:hypothetical protein [Kitasatospora cheerisanensis]|uniref:hypothetical protein n=1 Tax=Kitasatospora cheerisanensis TaxID=81942 RepID=UPI000690B9BD